MKSKSDDEKKGLSKNTNEQSNSITNKKCAEGYFIPDDDPTMEDCQKCSLEGCITCVGTYENNICSDCGNLKNIYNNGIIVKCGSNLCETGEEEKCLSCEENKNECQTCNFGYILENGECLPDYFIKIIYYTRQKEDTIDIINDISDVKHIYIEGEKIIPNGKSYQFQDEGNHIVYIQFKNERFFEKYLFYKNKHIKAVTFSNFGEYFIVLPLYYIFAECTNLTSVDFSRLSYKFESNTDHMFEGCINLTYANVNNIKVGFNAEYMFHNCKSLTSIELSNLDVSNTNYLNNMFEDCNSLQLINLKGFKLDKASNIQSMFKNCYSLKYLDVSSFKSPELSNINSAFYNCSSLTSINLLDFYSTELVDMGYLFYNCSSLQIIDFTDFNTKKVKYINHMFEGCESLTSTIIGQNFEITKNVKQINSMFARCYSLTKITFDITVTSQISLLSYLFSDCHSLTSVNLNNFDTTEVYDYEYMFHNCYNLQSIDISTFSFKRNANLKGMFSGCYLITTINFANIKADYYRFDEIFYDCPNLKYLDFSFLHDFPYYYFFDESYYLFNNNISQSGTLILDQNYYEKYLKELGIYPPNDWILELKN